MNPLMPLQIMVPVKTLHTLVALERTLAQRGTSSADHLSRVVRHDLAVGTDDEDSWSVPGGVRGRMRGGIATGGSRTDERRAGQSTRSAWTSVVLLRWVRLIARSMMMLHGGWVTGRHVRITRIMMRMRSRRVHRYRRGRVRVRERWRLLSVARLARALSIPIRVGPRIVLPLPRGRSWSALMRMRRVRSRRTRRHGVLRRQDWETRRMRQRSRSNRRTIGSWVTHRFVRSDRGSLLSRRRLGRTRRAHRSLVVPRTGTDRVLAGSPFQSLCIMTGIRGRSLVARPYRRSGSLQGGRIADRAKVQWCGFRMRPCGSRQRFSLLTTTKTGVVARRCQGWVDGDVRVKGARRRRG
jgi:hypothetical protein